MSNKKVWLYRLFFISKSLRLMRSDFLISYYSFLISYFCPMLDRIKSLAKSYAPEFIEVRHHLHAHPELSYQEFETSKFVQKKLDDIGVSYEIKATTGVIGLIKGN